MFRRNGSKNMHTTTSSGNCMAIMLEFSIPIINVG